MSSRASKHDPRLTGTWQSDRRRSLRHFKPRANCPPSSLRRFRLLFGKLIVHWGHGVCRTELDGYITTRTYEIVARDEVSVVVRMWSELFEEDRLQQIHFDGDWYWVALQSGSLCEFFRRAPLS